MVSKPRARPRSRIPFAVALLSLAPALLVLSQCSDATGNVDRTLLGSNIALGQGSLRSEVGVNRAGEPVTVAVVIEEAALLGLPATVPQGTETVVPLPTEATALPFNHLTVNWQPTGHPPAGVYNRPHFDVHFYLIDMQQRNTISPADPQFAAKVAKAPAEAAIPANYISDNQGIPRMGVHWNDSNAPEHHGQAFTQTFIYGFYDGKMIFLEPMVTKEFLEAKSNLTVDLAVPAQYTAPGFYPTRYRVRFDAARHEHRVELLGFIRRG